MENKLKIWGTLDASNHSLDLAAKDFETLLNGQEYRMRPEDVKRMRKYIAGIAKSITSIKSTLKVFESINNGIK